MYDLSELVVKTCCQTISEVILNGRAKGQRKKNSHQREEGNWGVSYMGVSHTVGVNKHWFFSFM